MSSKYIKELEDLIMDELIPMYLVGCRSSGRDPKLNLIQKKLLELRSGIVELPALLKKRSSP